MACQGLPFDWHLRPALHNRMGPLGVQVPLQNGSSQL
jgi:hypothetical protein